MPATYVGEKIAFGNAGSFVRTRNATTGTSCLRPAWVYVSTAYGTPMKGSILDTIGSPLVEVDSPDGTTVAAKIESFNPGGSAKDRPAMSMVEAAERDGTLE